MRETRLTVLLVGALVLAVCATSAEAATLYSFTAQEVYVRNDRGAFVIGTATGLAFRPIPGLSDTVLVQRYAHGRDWGYGLVSGHFRPGTASAAAGCTCSAATRGSCAASAPATSEAATAAASS
jgi:hypothetical protein